MLQTMEVNFLSASGCGVLLLWSVSIAMYTLFISGGTSPKNYFLVPSSVKKVLHASGVIVPLASA